MLTNFISMYSYYLYTTAVNNNQIIVQNTVFVCRNELITKDMSVDNNSVNIIHQRSILHVKHPERGIVEID